MLVLLIYAGRSCRPQLRSGYGHPCTSPEPVAIVILRERTSSRHFAADASATAVAMIAQVALVRRRPSIEGRLDLRPRCLLDSTVLDLDIESERTAELAREVSTRGGLRRGLHVVALDPLELERLYLGDLAEVPEAADPGSARRDFALGGS